MFITFSKGLIDSTSNMTAEASCEEVHGKSALKTAFNILELIKGNDAAHTKARHLHLVFHSGEPVSPY